MNFKKYIITMIAAVGIIVTLGVSCYASTDSVNVPVTYETKLYNLILNVGEGGIVYDGDQTVENGTVIYELKVEDIKDFRVSANKNNKIKSIMLNGVEMKENLNNEVKEQSIQVKGIGGESTLDVEFESIKNVVNPSEKPNENTPTNMNKPTQKPSGSVNTGDGSNILLLLLLFIASIVVMVKYYNEKKRRSKN